MAEVTTMKITRATRDRLRAALDTYESAQFWAAAEAAAAAETPGQRTERKHQEAAIDGWMDGLR